MKNPVCDCKFCGCMHQTSDETHSWTYANQDEWKQFIGYYSALRAPIDIITDKVKSKDYDYSFHYKTEVGKLNINEHSIYFVPSELNSYVKFKGKRYYLSQFHFHTSAENRLNGMIAPMELHLVHATVDTNEFFALALLLNFNSDSSKTLGFINELFSNLENTEDFSLDLSYLNRLETSRTYHFVGSLTGPPFLPANIDFFLISYTETSKHLSIYEPHFVTFLNRYVNNKSNEISKYNDNRYAEADNYLSIHRVK